MLDSAHDARQFVAGRTRAELDTDRMLVLALMKSLEIIGEAAVHVSDDAKQAHADLPWAQMAGIRHRLVHAYYDINLDILWETVQRELPPLIEALERVIRREADA